MELADRVRQRRIELGLSQEELAEKMGYSSRSSINKIEMGRPVSQKIIIRLAEALDTTPAYLMGWNTQAYDMIDTMTKDAQIYKEANISFIKVPLYGDISCGKGSFVEDNIIDYIAVPDDNLNPNSEYFAQYAKGDSMINAGIGDGDVIVFEKTNVLDDNKIGCFCIDEGIATCKKFKKGPSYIQLIPMNPKYDPIVVDLESENFRIVGKLRKVIKSFE